MAPEQKKNLIENIAKGSSVVIILLAGLSVIWTLLVSTQDKFEQEMNESIEYLKEEIKSVKSENKDMKSENKDCTDFNRELLQKTVKDATYIMQRLESKLN